jgi:hypothetical protein
MKETGIVCPGGASHEVALNEQSVEVRTTASGPPEAVTPEYACLHPHCGVLFFRDGRFVTGAHSRPAVGGLAQRVELGGCLAAELGSDGALVLAYEGGNHDHYWTVKAEDVPRAAEALVRCCEGIGLDVGGLLVAADGRAATPDAVKAMARAGDARVLLVLLAHLFQLRRLRGGHEVAEVLSAAGVRCEVFCWTSTDWD